MIQRSLHARFTWAALASAFLLGPAGYARAGDVLVGGVTPGGDLKITGDVGANDVTVTQNANGTVTVTGATGTTINGGKSHTSAKPVSGKLKIDGKGGDDTITVKDVTQTNEIYVKNGIGKNTITIEKVKTKGELKVKNSDGKIEIKDSSWGQRDIRPGKGTVTPATLNGTGGSGSVGKPPTAANPYQKGTNPGSQVPLGGQKQGLPTDNPGARGLIIPDVPRVD